MSSLIRAFRRGFGLEVAAIEHGFWTYFLVVANRAGHMEAVLSGQGLSIVYVLTSRSRILASGGAR